MAPPGGDIFYIVFLFTLLLFLSHIKYIAASLISFNERQFYEFSQIKTKFRNTMTNEFILCDHLNPIHTRKKQQTYIRLWLQMCFGLTKGWILISCVSYTGA